MSQPQQRSLRIRPFAAASLDDITGLSGEIYFDSTVGTLRIYNGIAGGVALMRADLSNAEIEIATGAQLGDNPPAGAVLQTGTLWFNTTNGRLYIYYNDGNSSQWVQPATPSYGSGGGGGGSGTVELGTAGRLAYYATSGTVIDDLSSISWASNTLTVSGSVNSTNLNVSGQKNFVRFHWDTLDDLNTQANPTTWHGMIAHVHETGRVYFAHSGAWTPLANQSDLGNSITGVVAGDNITVNNNNGIITINAVVGGGGGGITLEEAQDGSATLFANGSHTGITFTYIDGSNALNAVVTDIPLGTRTTGNYVASITTTSGITGGAGGTEGALITLGIDSSVVVLVSESQTLTNKTINGSNNTITNIANASLTNSSIIINGTSVSLGGTITISTASNLDSLTDVTITAPSLGQVLKYNGSTWINDADATAGGAGAGTVTSVSVTSANGFAGTVATASSTPAITITTSITGLLKGNATAISAAIAGTDYQTPIGTISGIVKGNGANALAAAVAGTDYQAPITLTTSGSSGAATFSSNILNIPQYAGGATAFTGLSDRADLTVDQFYLPAITRLDVTANGTSAYRFDQYSTADNPTIYAISGTTIAFDLTGASGHPFLIRFSGANYNTGLVHVTTGGTVTTGTSAQGKTSGTLYWKIPAGISGTYGYLCASHGGMIGTITIKDIAAI
jgi:plastocyanin